MKSAQTGLLVPAIIAMACICALLGGCMQATTTPFGAAKIMSEPAGAKVVNLADNMAIGTTPMDFTWETEDGKAEYIQLVLTKQGQADTVTSFWVNPRYTSAEDAAENPQIISVNLMQAR